MSVWKLILIEVAAGCVFFGSLIALIWFMARREQHRKSRRVAE